MHPCLQIEEILRFIFEFVYGDRHGKWHPKRRSLANLAITCRTFLRPALETLWFHLPSLGPLVMCLPEDAWVVRRNGWNLSKLFLKRTLVTADWERLQLYAPFVKSCCPSSELATDVDVDAEVFRALRIYKPNTPVLPNLRVLTWKDHWDTRYAFDLFLTANLLEISLPASPPDRLVSLKQTCNRLRKLDVHTNYLYVRKDPHPDVFSSIISDLVTHLPSLESINSGIPLTNDAIVCLSTFPNLRILSIPNSASDFLPILATNLPHPFSTLVQLTTTVYDLTSAASLLGLSRLKKLQSLNLTINITQADDAERLFLELVSSCSHDVLEGIVMDVTYPTHSNYHPLPARVLKHLFVFRRLWHLGLSISFDLDDNVVEQMAASWPRMRRMDFGLPFTPRGQPKITLRSLISVVKHCRNLSSVTLVLNISSRDLKSLRRGIEGLRNYQITYLPLLDAWIDDNVDPAHASSFLNALFPKLTSVYVISGRQKDEWGDINRRLQESRVMASNKA